MFGTIYDGRYNILLMGVFATYSGFIYNELFSVPLEALGATAWCSGERSDDAECLGIPGINASTSMQKWLRTNINEAYDFTTQQSKGVEVSWDVYPMGSDPGLYRASCCVVPPPDVHRMLRRTWNGVWLCACPSVRLSVCGVRVLTWGRGADQGGRTR